MLDVLEPALVCDRVDDSGDLSAHLLRAITIAEANDISPPDPLALRSPDRAQGSILLRREGSLCCFASSR